MNRLFGVARRQPNYVDILVPFTYGVDGYRFKWATNFDTAFTTFLTTSNVGFVDPAINPYAIDAQPLGGFTGLVNSGRNVRIVINPATYSIPDGSSFWLQFVPVIGAAEQTPGGPTLVLPDSSNHGMGMVTIRGTAPSGATSADALQLNVPRLMDIHNESALPLYVSTEQSGAETLLKPDVFSEFVQPHGAQSSLWIRGGGGAAIFSARCSLAFPR